MLGIDSRAEGLGAKPSIKIESPLTQRDPPLRSVIQTRGQWSPQYVRSRCIYAVYLHGARRGSRQQAGCIAMLYLRFLGTMKWSIAHGTLKMRTSVTALPQTPAIFYKARCLILVMWSDDFEVLPCAG